MAGRARLPADRGRPALGGRGKRRLRSGWRRGIDHERVEKLQALLAELIGMAAVTLIAAGAAMVATIHWGMISPQAALIAPGLLVMAMIYSIGDISGAHLNPAITLAFAARRAFPWRDVPAYWLVQIAGAILAAGLLYLLFGSVDHVGATVPRGGISQPLVIEMIVSFLLVFVVFGTATGHRLLGSSAALAVGGTIALDGLFAGRSAAPP